MSDILIRDMEMPKDCDSCPMLDDNGDYPTCILTWTSHGYNWNPFGQRMPDCPLVPVPPHGDLIEKSVIEKAINDACAECKEACIEFDGFFADCNQCIFQAVKKALVEAPTIIPAEPCKEKGK